MRPLSAKCILRSAVFDPLHGFAYLGQDSRPNQIVKIQVARDTPAVTRSTLLPGNLFQLSFTNTPGVPGAILATADLSTPLTNWPALGTPTETSPGQFQFTDPSPSTHTQRSYRIRTP